MATSKSSKQWLQGQLLSGDALQNDPEGSNLDTELMMFLHKYSQELLLPVEHGRPVGDGDGQVLPDASVSVARRHHHRLVVHVQGGGVIPTTSDA